MLLCGTLYCTNETRRPHRSDFQYIPPSSRILSNQQQQAYDGLTCTMGHSSEEIMLTFVKGEKHPIIIHAGNTAHITVSHNFVRFAINKVGLSFLLNPSAKTDNAIEEMLRKAPYNKNEIHNTFRTIVEYSALLKSNFDTPLPSTFIDSISQQPPLPKQPSSHRRSIQDENGIISFS